MTDKERRRIKVWWNLRNTINKEFPNNKLKDEDYGYAVEFLNRYEKCQESQSQ